MFAINSYSSCRCVDLRSLNVGIGDQRATVPSIHVVTNKKLMGNITMV